MKNLGLLLLFFLFFSIGAYTQVNSNSTYVNGYYKQNGTYVEGYYRTTPNSTINDNYSTYPNVNPYTGNQGTIQPNYSTPSYPTYSSPSYPAYSLPSYPVYSTPNYYRYP